MVLAYGMKTPESHCTATLYGEHADLAPVTDSIGNLKVTKRCSRRNVLRELHRSGVHRSSIGQLRGVAGRVLS